MIKLANSLLFNNILFFNNISLKSGNPNLHRPTPSGLLEMAQFSPTILKRHALPVCMTLCAAIGAALRSEERRVGKEC